jgi:hypothetical protein
MVFTRVRIIFLLIDFFATKAQRKQRINGVQSSIKNKPLKRATQRKFNQDTVAGYIKIIYE